MNMKELRERVGLERMEVALKLGKSEATIRFWETGRSVPFLHPGETAAILDLYKCTLDDLVQAIEETRKQTT